MIGRIRIGFALLALLLLLPLGLLLNRTLQSLNLEREMRHEIVASRVFDELERVLSEFLRVEEGRAVDQYSPVLKTGAPSPLAELPTTGFIIGHFQLDAEGILSTPYALEGKDDETSSEVTKVVLEIRQAVVRSRVSRQLSMDGKIREGVMLAAGRSNAAQDSRKQEKAKGQEASTEEEQVPGTTKTVQKLTLITDRREVAKEDSELDQLSKKSRPAYSELVQALNVGAKSRERRYDTSGQQELAEEEAFGDEVASESPLKETLVGQAAQKNKPKAPESVAFDEAEEAEDGTVERDEMQLGQLRALGYVSKPEEAETETEGGKDFKWKMRADEEDSDRLAEGKSSAEARSSDYAPATDEFHPAAARATPAKVAAASPAPRRKRFEPLTDKSNLGPSPMASALVDGKHLLLYRTSLREGASVVQQGLLVNLPALARWLQERVLGQGDLAEFIELDFGTLDASRDDGFASSSLEQKRFIYQHRFGEPFEELTARLSLAPLPDGGGAAYIYSIAALLIVVATFGLWAVYRMVAVAVHFAERRSNFAAAVSHELKTPLTAIRMYGEMLRDGMVTHEDKRDEYYSTITTEAERLTRLINNVLEFSKMEHGERELDMISGSMGSVVEDVTRILATHAKDQGFALTCHVEKDLPSVQYERDALAQILFNLVDNSLKYAAEADRKVVEVHCQSRGEGVDVTVRDFGPGISREHRPYIFDAFYRGESELTRKSKGTGIGLALVKGLAEKMGASVSAENCDQGGFAVCVRFPAGR